MGCSQSNIDLTIKSVMNIKVKPEIVQHETSSSRIVEDFLVLWLRPDSSTNFDNHIKKIRRIVSSVKIFTNAQEVLVFIRNVRFEKLFFIISTPNEYLRSLKIFEQIEEIYVYDIDFDTNPQLSQSILFDYYFQDIDALCSQLKIDVELCETDLILMNVTPSLNLDETFSSDKIKQETSFLCVQLMRELFLRLEFNENSKNDLVNLCRLHYADNEEQIVLIDEFEHCYHSEQALWWLLRSCFLWKMIQRMERTQDIDILYKFCFFLKDVHRHLLMLYQRHHVNNNDVLIVYRGKTFSHEQFDSLFKQNTGGLISVDSFLKTTNNRDLALEFICRRRIKKPLSIGVLFEISVPSSIENKRSPFIQLNKFQSEQLLDYDGLLFSLHSVFRIESVESLGDPAEQIWSIQLKLIDDEDSDFLRRVAPLRRSEVYSNPLSYMGKLFMEKGDYEHVEQCLLDMLNDPIIQEQPSHYIQVHKGLADNYILKKEYSKARQHYEDALEVILKFLPHQQIDLISIYDAIGKCYYEQGDFSNAVKNYEQAANLFSQKSYLTNENVSQNHNSRVILTKKTGAKTNLKVEQPS